MLALCERYGNEVEVVLFYRTESDMLAFLGHPYAVVGSDGSAMALDQGADRPHPRSFGTFPRVLGRYVRGRAGPGPAGRRRQDDARGSRTASASSTAAGSRRARSRISSLSTPRPSPTTPRSRIRAGRRRASGMWSWPAKRSSATASRPMPDPGPCCGRRRERRALRASTAGLARQGATCDRREPGRGPDRCGGLEPLRREVPVAHDGHPARRARARHRRHGAVGR